MLMAKAMLTAKLAVLYDVLYRTVDSGDWSSGGSSLNPPGFMCIPFGEIETVMNDIEKVRKALKEIEDGE